MHEVVRRALAISAIRGQFPLWEELPDHERKILHRHTMSSATLEAAVRNPLKTHFQKWHLSTGWSSTPWSRIDRIADVHALSPGTEDGEGLFNSYLASEIQKGVAADHGVLSLANYRTSKKRYPHCQETQLEKVGTLGSSSCRTVLLSYHHCGAAKFLVLLQQFHRLSKGIQPS